MKAYIQSSKNQLNKSNEVRTTDALWKTARVLVLESSIKWHTFLLLMLFWPNWPWPWPNSQKFNLCVTDGQTYGRTDGHTLLWRCENASRNP